MFGFHPANLAFRLLLELAGLVAIGVGAHTLADGFAGWIVAIGLPLIAAAAWGTFNVPDDRSRSGSAPVPIPGPVRLLIELSVFAAGVILLSFTSAKLAVVLGVAVAVHYMLSIDRIRWLLDH